MSKYKIESDVPAVVGLMDRYGEMTKSAPIGDGRVAFYDSVTGVLLSDAVLDENGKFPPDDAVLT